MRLASAASGRWAVLGSAALAYANALSGPFQFDDAGVITREPSVQSLGAYWAAAGSGLRPLLKASYALNWALDPGPFGFHVVNLCLHLFNVALVMRLTAAALERATSQSADRGLELGVLTAGLLFALHPLHTEAVTYISGRSSSLSTCFALLCVLCHVHARRSDEPRTRRRALGLGLLALGCGVLTKESVAALPGALLLWELCVDGSRFGAALKRLWPYWVLAAVALVVAVMHPRYFALLYASTGLRPLLDSLGYQLVGAQYLALRLVRVDWLCIDPGLGLHAPAQTELVTALVAALAAVVVAVTQRRRHPLLAFGAGWFLYHALVPYIFVPRLDVINERHAYLANVGVCVALGAGVQQLWQRVAARRALAIAGLALFLVLGARTAQRNRDYESEVDLWRSTLQVAPRNPRAHFNLGVAYERAGRTAEAQIAYAAALRLEPRLETARDRLRQLRPRARR